MRRRVELVLALAAASALALAVGAGCDGGDGDEGPTFVREGDVYPSVPVLDCAGQEVELGTIIAAHDVTFVTFGATWCVACQKEAPILNAQLVDGLADESVAVVQILIEDQPGFAPPLSLCSAWKTELNARFDVLVDTEQLSLPDHFAGGIQTLPLHFIVTRDGVIRLRKLGDLPTNIQQLVRDWLPTP